MESKNIWLQITKEWDNPAALQHLVIQAEVNKQV